MFCRQHCRNEISDLKNQISVTTCRARGKCGKISKTSLIESVDGILRFHRDPSYSIRSRDLKALKRIINFQS